MRLTKLERVESHNFNESLKQDLGEKWFKESYVNTHIERTISRHLNENVQFYRNSHKKTKSRLRLTFVFFAIIVGLFLFIIQPIKWILTGEYYFKSESVWIKWLINWAKYCVFKI